MKFKKRIKIVSQLTTKLIENNNSKSQLLIKTSNQIKILTKTKPNIMKMLLFCKNPL